MRSNFNEKFKKVKKKSSVKLKKYSRKGIIDYYQAVKGATLANKKDYCGRKVKRPEELSSPDSTSPSQF